MTGVCQAASDLGSNLVQELKMGFRTTVRTRCILGHTHTSTHTRTHTYLPRYVLYVHTSCAVVVPTQSKRSGQDPTKSNAYLRHFLLQTFLLSSSPGNKRKTPPTTTCQSFQVPFAFPGFWRLYVIQERSSKPESVIPPESELFPAAHYLRTYLLTSRGSQSVN